MFILTHGLFTCIANVKLKFTVQLETVNHNNKYDYDENKEGLSSLSTKHNTL